MKKRLKINGIIMFSAFLLLVAFPGIFFRRAGDNPLNAAAVVSGAAFILLGQLMRASSRGYKSEHSGKGTMLIQGGPYSFVRNPMYLGILFIGLGVVLTLFKWQAAIIFLAIFIIRYILLIFTEEKKLIGVFPAEFKGYAEKVPRIFPSLKSVFMVDASDCLPLKARWVKKEAGTIFAMLFFVLAAKAWQDIKNGALGVFIKDMTGVLAVTVLFAWLAVYLIKRTDAREKSASNKS